MAIEASGALGHYAVIAAMAAATYALRAGGLWIAGRFPLTPRFRLFLEYLAGSILVSLVVPLALKGGIVLTLAVLLAGTVAFTSGRATLAVLGAVALAAGLRQFTGL